MGKSSLRFIETAEGLNRTNREACQRIIGLAESLRSLAHLDQGKLKQADLHEAIDSVLNLLQHELEDRVTVVRTYGKIPNIVCYPGELHQMFLHLLLNAIRLSKDGVRFGSRRSRPMRRSRWGSAIREEVFRTT